MNSRKNHAVQAVDAGRETIARQPCLLDYAGVYRADPIERIRLVKDGIPATVVEDIAKSMSVRKEALIRTLGLARSTVDRKAKAKQLLSIDEGARVMAMLRMIGRVASMVEESGRSEGFVAPEWLAMWLDHPLAALNGETPAQYMDTPEGQELVSTLIARMESGAYS